MADLQNSLTPSAAPQVAAPAPRSRTTLSTRLSLLALIFAILSVVLFLLLVFLRIPFPLNPLMSWQDAIDVITALTLIPLYWLMYQTSLGRERSQAGDLSFVILAAVWAVGQGMHLSANSIDNLIGNLAKNQGLDVQGTDLYRLTYFYDEILSHYLWHIGVLGLALLLMAVNWRSTWEQKTTWQLVVPAGVLYGFNCFCIFVEGLTTPLSFPVVGLAAGASVLLARKQWSSKPVLAFFSISFILAFVLIASWSIYWGAFPPPELMK